MHPQILRIHLRDRLKVIFKGNSLKIHRRFFTKKFFCEEILTNFLSKFPVNFLVKFQSTRRPFGISKVTDGTLHRPTGEDVKRRIPLDALRRLSRLSGFSSGSDSLRLDRIPALFALSFQITFRLFTHTIQQFD